MHRAVTCKVCGKEYCQLSGPPPAQKHNCARRGHTGNLPHETSPAHWIAPSSAIAPVVVHWADIRRVRSRAMLPTEWVARGSLTVSPVKNANLTRVNEPWSG